MALKFDIRNGSEGVTTATQKGVLFPNGKIIWGDPNDENLVSVPELNSGSSGSGQYRLDRTDADTRDRYSVAKLNNDYLIKVAKASTAIQAPIDVEDYPRIVARQIMLAIGETTQL